MRTRSIAPAALFTLCMISGASSAFADVAPPSCSGTDPAIQLCSGKAAGDACTFSNGTKGNCAALRCATDGGAAVLSCVATGGNYSGGGCSLSARSSGAGAGQLSLAAWLAALATSAVLAWRRRRSA